MRLVNISNKGRLVYLFTRDEEGKQKVFVDKKFFPFYYEPAIDGEFIGYDGTHLKKVTVADPKQIRAQRTPNAYSSDIRYTVNYINHRIPKFDKCPFKYLFFDIEVLAKKKSEIEIFQGKVSSISLYNSFSDEYKNWNLLKLSEKELLEAFVQYIQKEKPDLLLAHNISFDYKYLHNRYHRFAEAISPIRMVRAGNEHGIFYPAGVSIVDYLGLFKKVMMREQSYALDTLSQKYLEEKEWGETDFGILNEHVVKKNLNDVARLVKLEQKFNLLPYYDEIRRTAKCLWEDMCGQYIQHDGKPVWYSNNSRIIDGLILQEAINKNVILPDKKKEETDEELQGAYRRAETGVFKRLYKIDVSSAYPSNIINFCLDPANVSETEGVDINGTKFIQDETRILPTITRNFIILKNDLKQQLSKEKYGTEKYLETERKYNAIKAVCNSIFGSVAMNGFRLYNMDVASAITFLARDLLKYIEAALQNRKNFVRYTDTDAEMYEAEEDLTEYINSLVKQWGREKYGIDDIGITLDGEGYFEKVLILGSCHYIGLKRDKKGELKEEVRGLEFKRSSSSKFEAAFQKEMLKQILNGADEVTIKDWVYEQEHVIKTRPLKEIGFPFKINGTYNKNTPIFVRAAKYAGLELDVGQVGYFVYIKSTEKDENDKEKNVWAFTKETELQQQVDWNEMIRRSIRNKYEKICEILKWDLVPANQLTLL